MIHFFFQNDFFDFSLVAPSSSIRTRGSDSCFFFCELHCYGFYLFVFCFRLQTAYMHTSRQTFALHCIVPSFLFIYSFPEFGTYSTAFPLVVSLQLLLWSSGIPSFNYFCRIDRCRVVTMMKNMLLTRVCQYLGCHRIDLVSAQNRFKPSSSSTAS